MVKDSTLIYECEEKIQVLINELESDIGYNIDKCDLYYGDIIVDDKETEGTKVALTTECGEDQDYIEELLPQDIIEEYHNVEAELKQLMSGATGLDNITDLYLQVIEEEKREARKALTSENEDLYKLL